MDISEARAEYILNSKYIAACNSMETKELILIKAEKYLQIPLNSKCYWRRNIFINSWPNKIPPNWNTSLGHPLNTFTPEFSIVLNKKCNMHIMFYCVLTLDTIKFSHPTDHGKVMRHTKLFYFYFVRVYVTLNITTLVHIIALFFTHLYQSGV